MNRAVAGRAAVAVLALSGGAVVGCCTVFVHGYWWGLLLGMATTVALLVVIPGGWWRRLPFALGWVVVVLLLSGERPEGDVLVQSNVNGYVLLGTGVGVLLGGVIGLRHHGPDAGNDGSDGSPS